MGKIDFAVAAGFSIAREVLRCGKCCTCSKTYTKISNEIGVRVKLESNLGRVYSVRAKLASLQ